MAFCSGTKSYYDPGFRVGQVLQVKDDGEKATISVYNKVRGKNLFNRADPESIKEVEAKNVLSWELEMPSTNGRNWCVVDLEDVENLYTLFFKINVLSQ